MKRKHQNTERIVTGIKGPAFGPVDPNLTPASKQMARIKT